MERQPAELREPNVLLKGRTVLRPMTENDWDVLLGWNSDPEVLYFSEGDDVSPYSLEDIQGMYRGVSQSAYCFIIELDGRPIGECWLQQMNLERILQKHPGEDCRRIDLMIGERDLWGCGIGTDMIRTLTRFGFEKKGINIIFVAESPTTIPGVCGPSRRLAIESTRSSRIPRAPRPSSNMTSA